MREHSVIQYIRTCMSLETKPWEHIHQTVKIFHEDELVQDLWEGILNERVPNYWVNTLKNSELYTALEGDSSAQRRLLRWIEPKIRSSGNPKLEFTFLQHDSSTKKSSYVLFFYPREKISLNLRISIVGDEIEVQAQWESRHRTEISLDQGTRDWIQSIFKDAPFDLDEIPEHFHAYVGFQEMSWVNAPALRNIYPDMARAITPEIARLIRSRLGRFEEE